MGATDFTHYVKKTEDCPTPEKAFYTLRDNAARENGQQGYTGTIAEKRYFVLRQAPMKVEDAKDFIDEDIENNDKWGPAFCIPVFKQEFVRTGVYTTTVNCERREALYVAGEEMRLCLDLAPGEFYIIRKQTNFFEESYAGKMHVTAEVSKATDDYLRRNGPHPWNSVGPTEVEITYEVRKYTNEIGGWYFYGLASD